MIKQFQSKTTRDLIALTEQFGTKYLGRTKAEVNTIIENQLLYLKNTEFDQDFLDPRSTINLDTTKLLLHEDRLKAFLDGKKIAPITVDMALTQKCSYACTFCYAGLQQNPSSPAEWDVYKSFLDDCRGLDMSPARLRLFR